MSVSQIQKILDKIGEFCERSALWKDVIREISWGIVNFLQFLCDQAETLLNSAYGLFDFATTQQVKDFIASYRPVLWIAFAMALIILGYNLIVNRDSKPKVFQAFMLMMCFLTLMPQLLMFFMDFTEQAIGTVNPGKVSATTAVVQNNIADLRYLDKNNFNVAKGLVPKNVNLDYIDPNETIYPDEKTVKNKDFFKYYLAIDESGKTVKKSFDFGGWNSMWVDSTYYRYHINFFAIFVSLLSTIIVLFFTAYKVMRIIFEIVVGQFLGTLFAVSDLMSGERLKKVIKSMASSLFVLFMVAVLLKIYYLFNAYLTLTISNGWVRAILLLFVSFAVIDGPNIIQATLGVDSGIKSGFQSFASVLMATQTVSRLSQDMNRVIAGATRPMREAAGMGIGAAAGFGAGFSMNRNNQESQESQASNNTEGENSAFNRESSSTDASEYGGVHGFDSHGDNSVSSSSSFSGTNSVNGTSSQNNSSSANVNQSQATSESSSGVNNNTISSHESSAGIFGSVPEKQDTSSSDIPAASGIAKDEGAGIADAANNLNGFAQSEYAEQAAGDSGYAQQELAAEKGAEFNSGVAPSPEFGAEKDSIDTSKERATPAGAQSPEIDERSQSRISEEPEDAVQKKSNLNSTQGFNGAQKELPAAAPAGQQTRDAFSGARPEKRGFIHGIRKGFQTGKSAADKRKNKK